MQIIFTPVKAPNFYGQKNELIDTLYSTLCVQMCENLIANRHLYDVDGVDDINDVSMWEKLFSVLFSKFFRFVLHDSHEMELK